MKSTLFFLACLVAVNASLSEDFVFYESDFDDDSELQSMVFAQLQDKVFSGERIFDDNSLSCSCTFQPIQEISVPSKPYAEAKHIVPVNAPPASSFRQQFAAATSISAKLPTISNERLMQYNSDAPHHPVAYNPRAKFE